MNVKSLVMLFEKNPDSRQQKPQPEKKTAPLLVSDTFNRMVKLSNDSQPVDGNPEPVQHAPSAVETVLEQRVSVKSLIYNFQKLSAQNSQAVAPSLKKDVGKITTRHSAPSHSSLASPKPSDGVSAASTAVCKSSSGSKSITTSSLSSERDLFFLPEAKQEVVVAGSQQSPGQTQPNEADDTIQTEMRLSETSSIEESKEVSYTFSPHPSGDAKHLSTSLSVEQEPEDSVSSFGDSDLDDDFRQPRGYSELPKSYRLVTRDSGRLELELPPPPMKSAIKKAVPANNKSVSFSDAALSVVETYNSYEYARADEDLDILAATAEYEFEKSLELMEKITVTVKKGPLQRLGIQVYGMGMRRNNSKDNLAIYIKAVAPGSPCDICGNIKEDDLILEMNGVSLLGVNIPTVNNVLKSAGDTITLVLARDSRFEEEGDESVTKEPTL